MTTNSCPHLSISSSLSLFLDSRWVHHAISILYTCSNSATVHPSYIFNVIYANYEADKILMTWYHWTWHVTNVSTCVCVLRFPAFCRASSIQWKYTLWLMFHLMKTYSLKTAGFARFGTEEKETIMAWRWSPYSIHTLLVFGKSFRLQIYI